MSFPGNPAAALALLLNELPFNSIKLLLDLTAQGRINIAPAPGNKVALAGKIRLGEKLVWPGCYGWHRWRGNGKALPLHPGASPRDSSLAEGWLRRDGGSRSPLNPNRLSLCKER